MEYLVQKFKCTEQVDSNNMTILAKYILRKGNFEIAEKLLARNADINFQNSYGQTVLHMAVQEKNYDAIRFLLSHEANPHLEDANKMDCCDLARENSINNDFPELNNCNRLKDQ